MKNKILLIFIAFLSFANISIKAQNDYYKANGKDPEFFFPKDKLKVFEVTTAPFEIDRKYKSMEGPLIRTYITPEGLDNRHGKHRTRVPASQAFSFVVDKKRMTEGDDSRRSLWWLLGVKVEALDPVKETTISEEFICHLNMDFNWEKRAKYFPSFPGDGTSTRLFTLTPGATKLILPSGYGVPLASDEEILVDFQALNHNKQGKFAVRHKLTLYCVRDLDLINDITPLKVMWPFIAQVTKGKEYSEMKPMPLESQPCANPIGWAKNARVEEGMASGYELKDGTKLTGHWIVPEGKSTYSFPVSYYGYEVPYQTTIHAMIPHVHPYTEFIEMIGYGKDCSQKTIFRSKVQNAQGKTGLVKIGTYSSPKGIALEPGHSYELFMKYNNTSGQIQDSMGTMGVFYVDKKWQRPIWADAVVSNTKPTCGVHLAGKNHSCNHSDHSQCTKSCEVGHASKAKK